SYTIFSILSGKIPGIHVKLKSLKAGGFSLEDAELINEPGRPAASFHVNRAGYNEINARGIRGSLRMAGKTVFLESFTAGLFGGGIRGDGRYALDKKRGFMVKLEFASLDIDDFVREMKLDNKFRMTGTINGSLSVEGEGPALSGVKGDFFAEEGGGLLIIKDMSFLENMAKRANTPVDIVVESFKNYQYNNGGMRVSLEGGNLILDIALDGPAGKRSFNVILHGVNTIIGRRS
ncbi:MAG: YdbH domain-containing protein, partial [Candidatus Omnitrophica bacterium]|nr:YdbH domain-containing protein [Candidatus Omnitrophota bacterium]